MPVNLDSLPATHFSRKPYTVSYLKDGKKMTIKRQPPATLHKMLPTDIVELNQTKNSEFVAGDEFTIKGINPRQPNIIQIEDDEGLATFVPYYDLILEEAVAPRSRSTAERQDSPEENRYLLWP